MTDDGVRQHRCPNCGASLDGAAANATPRTTCGYCGQTFEVQGPPPRPTPAAQPPRRPPPNAARRPGLGPSGQGVVVLAMVGAAALFVSRRATNGTLGLPTMAVPSLPVLPAPKAATAYLWDTVGGPPLPAGAGPNGAERFVGRVRSRADDTLWIAAFDGPKVTEAWRAGPFGTYSEGYQSTFAAVVGRQVVVTDFHANAHVFDVGSGHELRSVKLSDRAKSMCAAPDGEPRVWIEVADGKNVLVDAGSGTAAPAARPAWCSDGGSSTHDCRGWLRRGPFRPQCKAPGAAPAVSGFQAINVVEEGDTAVALGMKHPGTATPMAVGFDPKTKTVRWQGALASGDQAAVAESSTISAMDAMAGGRFVAPYQITSKGWHFTALDVHTGERLWDVPLQPLVGVDYPEGFSVSATRVYVMRTSSLEVYDAKTGTLAGAIGD